MKINNAGQTKLIKNPHGQYELIGPTKEELEAAKQWAEFWGHEIFESKSVHAPIKNCSGRRLIPGLFKFQRATLFVRTFRRIEF